MFETAVTLKLGLRRGTGVMELCKLCDKEAESLENLVESSLIEMIKKNNPDWVESDGSCTACVSYYKSLDQMVVQEE